MIGSESSPRLWLERQRYWKHSRTMTRRYLNSRAETLAKSARRQRVVQSAWPRGGKRRKQPLNASARTQE